MNANLQSWLGSQIQQLKDQHLHKVPKILQSPAAGRVRMNGKEVVNLSSNNYLGLANHPKVVAAAKEAIDRWGVGAGAVRWIGGTMSVHDELEERLAKFKHVEAVLVFTSGFTANSGCIPAVLTDKDVVISDELNHASIIDGVRLSPAKYKKSEGYVYAHKDMEHLERILKTTQQFEKRMIITDGVFSMDGDIAPLPEIVRLAEENDAFVMVDDAHASGVLGKNGAGTTSHFDLYGRVDIQLGTLSKALGVVGGYIAGSALLKDWLINRGRPYLFSTAHPPAVAAALIAAIDVMETDPEPMRRLWDNTRWWKGALQEAGFDIREQTILRRWKREAAAKPGGEVPRCASCGRINLPRYVFCEGCQQPYLLYAARSLDLRHRILPKLVLAWALLAAFLVATVSIGVSVSTALRIPMFLLAFGGLAGILVWLFRPIRIAREHLA